MAPTECNGNTTRGAIVNCTKLANFTLSYTQVYRGGERVDQYLVRDHQMLRDRMWLWGPSEWAA